MSMAIKSKEQAIRDAKFNEETARRQMEANLRYGNTEDVVVPPDTIDIPAAQKEVSRLQVPFFPIHLLVINPILLMTF